MSEPRQPVIVGGARTPVGRLLGSLASKSASELGGVAIAEALERAGVRPDQVDYVIMGQVLQAGAGQIPARQAAVAAGIPMTVPALTVNKVCLSGLDAIALAAQLIRLGEYDVIVAGGMESMTQAPHLLPNSRAGYKYGPFEVQDSMAIDALTALARTKVPFVSTAPLCEQEHVQLEVAWAKTRLLAARAFAFEAVGALWASVSEGRPAPVEQQALVRMACCNAGDIGKEVVGRMYELAGSTALLEEAPFAAQLRDINAACQHINFANRLMVPPGRILLGLDPRTARF